MRYKSNAIVRLSLVHRKKNSSFAKTNLSPQSASPDRSSSSFPPPRIRADYSMMSPVLSPPSGRYPAKHHAARVADLLLKQGGDHNGVIYLEAQRTRMTEDSDHPQPFRQRRFFYYLAGCDLPDCSLIYDISKQHLTLFIPPVDPEDVMWSGLPLTTEEAMIRYDIDDAQTLDKVNIVLAGIQGSTPSTIYVIPEQVSASLEFSPSMQRNSDLLKSTIERCRVVKSSYEIEMIRYANKVSTAAHVAVMKAAKAASTEQELQALFMKCCIEQGLKEQAYTGIFAAGTAAATLHYIRNDQSLKGKQLLLLDAGAEYKCYASDITRTFPLSGEFTPESKTIYDTVLRMQQESLAMIKEGVLWDHVHAQAHRVAIQGLLDAGILQNGTVEEIFANRTSVAFFPHGLGHYLGMDTHDTGGEPNYADDDSMFRYLRCRQCLPAGSVITVEPGVYFCRYIIEPYSRDERHSKYINLSVLDKYWDVGGVRIEDNVVVTKEGYENLTPTPKEIDQVLQLLNGQ